MTKEEKELKSQVHHLIQTNPVWNAFAKRLQQDYTAEELKKLAKVLRANNKAMGNL